MTLSHSNAKDVRDFVPTLHCTLYPDIDPSLVRLPQPYVACIFGGRGAVGSGLARSYARAGATGLILCARTLSALDSTAKEVKAINPSIKTLVISCDITSASSVASAAAAANASFNGRIDAVIVNSGYSGQVHADITLETPEDFQQAFNVHAVGTYHAAHNFLPLLYGAKSPAFLTISSMAAPTVTGPIAHIHYCASKMAQARIIEMISEQAAGKSVLCASVHPGGVVSDFSKAAMPEEYHHCKLHVPEPFKPDRFRMNFSWLTGIISVLVDDPDLAGSFCVWLTKDGEKAKALNGRFLSCKWDVKELLGRLDDIQARDLLKFRIAI
jgi:NAD(P)-dependent dehydrogenase (short-subunit alcohol dehydrogenase family)